MAPTIIAIGVAPLLTAASTVAARRWGPRTGGVVSAFPAIVGPVLLLAALQHGRGFAARAAEGTLLGLVGLAAFAAVYARVASRRPWRPSLAAAWAAAAVTSAVAGALGGRFGPPAGLLLATASLFIAYRALPTLPALPAADERTGIPLRMALAAALVITLSAAAGALGPVAGGVLAALPVLASLLAVLTHRDAGPAAAASLLRGMLAGMGGFVIFCELVAVLLAHVAVAPAFAAATAAAVLVQMVVAARSTPAPVATR